MSSGTSDKIKGRVKEAVGVLTDDQRLKDILMSVHTEDSKERDRAKKIFEDGGGEDISYTGEVSVSKDQMTAAERHD
jgi:hypothetical protein